MVVGDETNPTAQPQALLLQRGDLELDLFTAPMRHLLRKVWRL
jgi:hypothetical protein